MFDKVLSNRTPKKIEGGGPIAIPESLFSEDRKDLGQYYRLLDSFSVTDKIGAELEFAPAAFNGGARVDLTDVQRYDPLNLLDRMLY